MQILKRCNELPLAMRSPCSICAGCNSEIEHGRSVDVLGTLWHPECLCCDACHKPIAIHEVENHVSNSRGKFHKSCYGRYCYVCKEKVKINMFHQHHFWKESYCPAHESDGTPRCCGCERLEPKGANFVVLRDCRCLCPECMESAVMDFVECHSLHFDMHQFFDGLNMEFEQDFPIFLVDKKVLDEAENEDYVYEVVIRVLSLYRELTVSMVSEGAKMGPNNLVPDMATESQEVVRKCEITAILILYGLPRFLTGYILAHEMMHAYLRLNGYRNLNRVLEEGICQMVAHMWLESQTYAITDAAAAASSSSTPPPSSASDFEKKLLEFCKVQISSDGSPIYGVGFKKVNEMMVSNNYNLKDTLRDIFSASQTIPDSEIHVSIPSLSLSLSCLEAGSEF